MSVFDDIDQKRAAFERLLADTKEQVRAQGGAFVRADELGWWRCSYQPTKGDRTRVELRARSAEDLVAQLKAARPPLGRKP